MSSQPKITWHDKAFVRKAFAAMEKRMDVCAELLKQQMQLNISIPTSGSGPSQPGEFPHLDTNELRSKLFWQREGDKWTVGSPTPHGRLLEEGTRRMAPRPWCRRTLEENMIRIRKIVQQRAKL